MTLKYSRNKCRLGRRVGGCLSRGKVRCGSCKYSDLSSMSCPVCTGGITRTVLSNRYRGKVLVYKANVKVSVATGGFGKVETTIYASYFATRTAELRGSTGVLTLNKEIMKPKLTLGVISAFLGAPFSGSRERVEEVGRVRARWIVGWRG